MFPDSGEQSAGYSGADLRTDRATESPVSKKERESFNKLNKWENIGLYIEGGCNTI